MATLKQLQRDAVRSILNFNKPIAADEADALMCDQWKVLIYDNECRDIITPLLTVQQLRQQGVTLYLGLDSERDPIPDVSAIYVVRPTPDNVRRVAADAGKGLYRAVHVNFVSPTPRTLLEEFARQALQHGGAAHISRVFDQRLNFVALEPSLATLGIHGSFAAYNRPSCSEDDIVRFVSAICDGALALFATTGAVPVIRAPRDGVAAMVAERLAATIAEHVRGQSDLFRGPQRDPALLGAPALRRPVLLVLDRTADLVAPVQHGVAYQSLVDDVLRHRLNRVSVPSADGGKPRTFHLDTEADEFWRENASAAFPEAVESNGRELAQVIEEEKRLTASATGAAEDLPQEHTQSLQRAVDRVPRLVARKKQLEAHTSLLQACMDALSKRHIPRFFEVEDDVIAGSLGGDAARARVVEVVEGEGSAEDKVRACLVWALACSPSDADVERVELALVKSLAPEEGGAAGDGTDSAASLAPADRAVVASLEWLRKHRKIARLTASHGAAATEGASAVREGASGLASLWSVADSVTGHAASLVRRATQTVKNMLPRSKRLFASRALLAMCSARDCRGEFEGYLYLDPKAPQPDAVPEEARVREFEDAVLLVVGGGCYTEYHNVMEEVAGKAGRNVVYAATEMVSPRAFVDQLAALGAQQ